MALIISFVIFILLLLVGFSNAVNLTDGLDGLAGGLSAISFVAFALISLFIGQEDMGIFCFILVGTIAGFLMFNAYPARIFMGDTGSLALGGVLATIAILTRREITLFIICLPFVIETASSMIQILYYKLTKKRVFLNSPLHHHFEARGWPKYKVTMRYWIISIITSIVGVIISIIS
jgi:phospho-N-acetylmuramoyl-pentapeptide-transferase